MQISLCACARMRLMGSNLPEHLHVTSCAHLYVLILSFCVLSEAVHVLLYILSCAHLYV